MNLLLFVVALLVPAAAGADPASGPAGAPAAGPAAGPAGAPGGAPAGPVFVMPTAEPTLSPARYRNFQPMRSKWEQIRFQEGPTVFPPSRDCVRTPARSMCDCKEMIAACHEESYDCDVRLQSMEERVPGIQADNYQSKFNHPLLNTLTQLTKRRRSLKRQSSALRSSRPKKADPECKVCLDQLKTSWSHAKDNDPDAESEGATLVMAPPDFPGEQEEYGNAGELDQPGYAPPAALVEESEESSSSSRFDPSTGQKTAEFGWRIFNEGPDWGSVLRGKCTVEEMDGLEQCLSYFWACDQNRKRLEKWSEATTRETDWIDAHPGKRPGIH